MISGVSKRLIASLAMAVVLVSHIFLFVPFSIYSGNSGAFIFYEYKPDWRITEYTGPIQEFIIKGRHIDVTWQAGEVFLPPETFTLR